MNIPSDQMTTDQSQSILLADFDSVNSNPLKIGSIISPNSFCGVQEECRGFTIDEVESFQLQL